MLFVAHPRADEGTNSPRLFTPGETKALGKSKVHQITRAHGSPFIVHGWSSSVSKSRGSRVESKSRESRVKSRESRVKSRESRVKSRECESKKSRAGKCHQKQQSQNTFNTI